jgi:ribulose-phosphate 3-epimerase
MKTIVPTVVPDTLSGIQETSDRYAPFANHFHIDATDGIFAPNTTWFPREDNKLPENFSYEVHLMVSEPEQVGIVFAKAGAKTIIGHVEAFKTPENARRAFSLWRKAGAEKVGVAVLLQTPVQDIVMYSDDCDLVLMMTIARIGVQGIPFEESGIARVAELHAMKPAMEIAVDGGVSEKNIELLARAGASRFSVGSAISKSADPAATYQYLLSLANRV